MDKYKVGDILALKDDLKRRFKVIQIDEVSDFPIKVRDLKDKGVVISFEVWHADRDLINLSNGELSKILYE